MRFPRNTKIFRGQIDFAPLAGVFFLLLIFVLLSSLVYTPGVPVEFSKEENNGASSARHVVRVTRKGEIIFQDHLYKLDELERLRSHLKTIQNWSVHADPDAPREIVARLTRIELPVAETFSSTDLPVLTVGVGLGGQLFYENKLIGPVELEDELKSAVARIKGPVALMLLLDESVETKVTIQLCDMARRVGVKEVWQAVRPAASMKLAAP